MLEEYGILYHECYRVIIKIDSRMGIRKHGTKTTMSSKNQIQAKWYDLRDLTVSDCILLRDLNYEEQKSFAEKYIIDKDHFKTGDLVYINDDARQGYGWLGIGPNKEWVHGPTLTSPGVDIPLNMAPCKELSICYDDVLADMKARYDDDDLGYQFWGLHASVLDNEWYMEKYIGQYIIHGLLGKMKRVLCENIKVGNKYIIRTTTHAIFIVMKQVEYYPNTKEYAYIYYDYKDDRGKLQMLHSFDSFSDGNHYKVLYESELY